MDTFYEFVRAAPEESLSDLIDGRIPYFQQVVAIERRPCGCCRVTMRTDEADLAVRWEMFLQDMRETYASGDLARMQAHWDTYERRRNADHFCAPDWLVKLVVESNNADFIRHVFENAPRDILAKALDHARSVRANESETALMELHEALGV